MLNEIRKIRNGLLGEAKKELVTSNDYIDKINHLQRQITSRERAGKKCPNLHTELDKIWVEYKRKFPRTKELVTLKNYIDKMDDLQRQIDSCERRGDDCHLLQKELDRIHKEYRRKFPRKEKPYHRWS